MNYLIMIVMAHRYIYFVLGGKVISDEYYDELLAQARTTVPKGHFIHWVGSKDSRDYTKEDKQKARFFLKNAKRYFIRNPIDDEEAIDDMGD